MNVHDHITYAVINNESIVDIFICEEYSLAQKLAKKYGDNCFAVNCSNFKVCIGDLYQNGAFYNGETGVEIKDTSFDAQMAETKHMILMQTNAILDLSNHIALLMQEKE